MALIVRRITAKVCYIILVPLRPVLDMIDRHVHRKSLKADCDTTCIVSNNDGNWTGKPTCKEVVGLLLESLASRMRPVEGENSYPFASDDLMCRSFRPPNWAVSEPYKGDFIINLVRIKGRARASIALLQKYEELNKAETTKIENLFRKIADKCAKEIVLVLHHIHPVERKSFLQRAKRFFR